MKVLLIIPAYNEAANLPSLIEEVRAVVPDDYDILVVNDGSYDNTSSTARELGALLVDLPVNLGIGGAVQTGYMYAYYNLYDIAVQMDGDGQHDPIYLEALIKPISDGIADMVIGSRFINNNGFQSTFLRRVGKGFFTLLISVLTGKQFTDPTSGFRACNKDVISHFASYYPSDYPEPESLVTMVMNGYRLMEIPVVMRERAAGRSSIRRLNGIYYMIKVTLAIMIEMIKNHTKERYTYDGTKVANISDRY